jgi:hypothetical protein
MYRYAGQKILPARRAPPGSAIIADQNKPASDIPIDPARREALFRAFLEWQQRRSVEHFLPTQEGDTQAR